MTEAELQLQNALTTTFLANLAFLSEYDKDLYLRIDNLSQAIDEGIYEERFFLEFLEKEGEFDIYDKKENRYVYDQNPKKLKNKAKNLDFTSKGSFSDLKRGLYSGEREEINFDLNEPISLDNSFRMILNDVSDYVDVFSDKIGTYENKRFKSFEKFIIIGTLLSRHLLNIHKKFNPELYFICESNLEIFRLSLFVFDYTELVRDGGAIIFSIMDDDNLFDKKCSLFMLYKPYKNYCLKFFTTDYNVSSLFDNIANSFSSNNPFNYNYISLLYNLLNNNSKIIGTYNRVKLQAATGVLTDKPILFIGAGPSLEDEIEWISKNQNKFIIISMAAALKKIIPNKIIPDIIATADSGEKVVLDQFDLDNNIEYIKDKIIFASSMTSYNILANFKKENVFIFDVMSSFFTDSIYHNGYSIGEITLSWLLSLNCKEIYLLGVDLALNQKTGETHMSEHVSSKKLILSDDTFFVDKGNFSTREDTVEVKGNFFKKVKTTRLFMLSLIEMNNIIKKLLVDEQKVYNLSKNGAFINNTIPSTSDDIKLKDINKNIDKMKKNLIKISTKFLSDDNKQSLEMEVEYLKNFLYFLNNSEKKKLDYKEFEKYINSLYDNFNENIYKMVASKGFLLTYLNTHLLYIDYCLNDKSIKKENQKINETLEVLEKQINNLIKNYLKYTEIVKNI
ncbi:6-hydroxymethylpterin diphosphokinase MptE-like protein [Halarcobacter anaerophilus]|uniref:Motility accessory factor n=1 Tax=Halarcobacter anaerophilus TaxID=877500 RepID=A0A4Q0XYN6_9BACT|nr:6-hydroxymethylpterin diphosphokinase MptE-like protein [Halarcobacter anaerophilus]QDF30224.1 motility accessory factor [Halarcobacter anaerophilus]RXJ62215.1 hypothetical protein CRV06_10650 [Halarcobacter anaerophilus]